MRDFVERYAEITSATHRAEVGFAGAAFFFAQGTNHTINCGVGLKWFSQNGVNRFDGEEVVIVGNEQIGRKPREPRARLVLARYRNGPLERHVLLLFGAEHH